MKKMILVILCACFALLPAFAANIQVTAPAEGASWKIGTTQTVQWTFSGLPAATKVHVLLWHEGTNLGKIAKQYPIGSNGQGSFSWSVGAVEDAPAAVAGSGYSIKVRTVDDTTADVSGTFSLTSGSTISGPQASQLEHNFDLVPKKNQPAMPGVADAQVKMIQVTQPQAGDVLDPTSTYLIRWKFINVPQGDTSLTLLRDGQPAGIPGGSITDPNEFRWNLELQPPDPGNYKVAVETLDKLYRGLSGMFTIEEQGSIEAISPGQGMLFFNGSSQEVKWKRVGNIQRLNITLKKVGSNWEQVLATDVDAKLETLTLVFSPGQYGQYKIEFKYTVDGGFSYIYSGAFTIQGDQ
jgi:hypothetical protein